MLERVCHCFNIIRLFINLVYVQLCNNLFRSVRFVECHALPCLGMPLHALPCCCTTQHHTTPNNLTAPNRTTPHIKLHNETLYNAKHAFYHALNTVLCVVHPACAYASTRMHTRAHTRAPMCVPCCLRCDTDRSLSTHPAHSSSWQSHHHSSVGRLCCR